MKHTLSWTSLLCCVFIGGLAQVSAAADGSGDMRVAKGRIAAGLNYPGVGLRYFFVDQFAAELRGQFEKDILVGGLRVSRYFGFAGEVLPYLGVEADYVTFKGALSKGTGYALQALAGGEYFVWQQQVSVQLDFGPAYLALAETNFDIDVSGIEFVVNFGINYYFGVGGR